MTSQSGVEMKHILTIAPLDGCDKPWSKHLICQAVLGLTL